MRCLAVFSCWGFVVDGVWLWPSQSTPPPPPKRTSMESYWMIEQTTEDLNPAPYINTTQTICTVLIDVFKGSLLNNVTIFKSSYFPQKIYIRHIYHSNFNWGCTTLNIGYLAYFCFPVESCHCSMFILPLQHNYLNVSFKHWILSLFDSY